MPDTDGLPQKKQSTAYWMGQVDTTLTGLRESFDNFTKNDEHNWLDERAWRATISVAISGLDKRLFALETKVKGPPDNSEEQLENKVPTWKWIADKLGAPIILAIIIFLMLTFIPQIITHLAGK
jgi:hypothetical protein